MEQPFRCNNQTGGYCRGILTEEAVVTTCSHIFCIACSKKVGLSDARLDHRICPVCSTRLPNTDDAVQTTLNPTEEYKTSVLSGLGPTSIIECAGRALAFWTYQTTQEISYQQHVTKNLTERYSHLSTAMDKVIHGANSEIQSLQTKVEGLTVDYTALEQKHAEVVDLYREKSRKHAQAQKLYDTLKQKYQAEQMQTAASANVAQAIESIDAERRPETLRAAPSAARHHPGYADTTIPHLECRPSRRSSILGTLEQLHPHQRSGSSAIGSTGTGDQQVMPPPERPRISRIRECLRSEPFGTVLILHSKPPDIRNSNAPCCFARNSTSKRKSIPNSNGY
ncbi:uncharacterized protein A1O9_10006 [Exophiala aquamarina CBS 119918]|uniref:RING-type domain-containing protein n=1 Tax=Exophiala aquamarina CBS 119918 TaxID=1182545 RepID=A0A072PF71_9EURO|nr:uncharacterized protein A1O9_10006 [Exophiala aquamarina CBS 119918]KEF54210.1 hypothetical protein A1O9_10006 [Exophiala aquamarina CBS 119918]